ncbi:MAG: flagellar hook-basal body complex protein FliE [Eubacteriales bacterium]|nr:flagellar hook-basal body complex protein FliE [Eubacteriales bacterium]
MFIVPMNSYFDSAANALTQKLNSTASDGIESGGLDFSGYLRDLVRNVEDTEAVTEMDAYNLSIGNMDDTHTMLINAAKAEVALQTMIQLRTKVLDAYSEIMRISL